jgi:crossover junction endodeoxyribonuclease RuvC
LTWAAGSADRDGPSTARARTAARIERVFVLGIDPGLSRCGYGAIVRERAGLRMVAAGVITTPASQPLPDRLAALARELRSLVVELAPDAVAVERVLFQANARTAMAVGQASGLALMAAAERGCPVVQYSPNEVKQAVVGYGGATKSQVQRMVQSLLHLGAPPRPADTADALALAICHLTGAPLRAAVTAAAVKS